MMEKFYHSDFEDLIKDKADQYKMYPSDKVWKNINNSLRSRRKWYWTGFVLLLSGISVISITEIMKPAPVRAVLAKAVPATPVKQVSPEQLNPFSPSNSSSTSALSTLQQTDDDTVLSNITIEDSGTITASFDIPLQVSDASFPSGKEPARGSLVIEGLEPLASNEIYKIELSLPSPAVSLDAPALPRSAAALNNLATEAPLPAEALQRRAGDNWLEDNARVKPVTTPQLKKISWQLAFSPTVNYRKLTGANNAKIGAFNGNIPLASQINGNINSLVNHRPALGFELGTHAFMSLSNRVTLKGGVQFNYSKYDIRAYKSPTELATISLNSTPGRNLNSFTSYTDIRNFGGASVDNLKNQYFQFSLPVGLELRVLGNDRLQFDIAGTIQPTILLNKNSYLITTDYKNYTQAPSLVRRWNMNAGAEAYLSYNRGGVKWQVGPQFRYQLFSTYDKAYPIREYLMEYGIKVGITKTIR